MSKKPQIIRTPKAYYVTRRIEGQRDWAFAFWRELFQNEVDAGAKRIDITLGDADGKGSFGRDPTLERVVRVTFAGDGKGMDAETLENVFFRPGESTKKIGDGNTGGFGTARLMLCFSQVRYAIRTQDLVVEGDGSEYTVETVEEAIASRQALIAELTRQLESEEQDEAERAAIPARIEALRDEQAALEADRAFRKGCKFEIDIDPKETGSYWRDVDLKKLTKALDQYLSMSQVPCKVFVNGREVDAKSLKGPARRQLVAHLDGQEVAFATVHTSLGERAKHKGKVIVRLNGATMFAEDTSAAHQVIVELEPTLGKKVLTDNRDGLKSQFTSAMNGFIEELVVDTRSALEEKDKRKHIEIKGGRGKLKAEAPVTRVSFGLEGYVAPPLKDAARLSGATAGAMPLPSDEEIEAMAEGAQALSQVPGSAEDAAPQPLPKASYTTPEEYEVRGFGGVPKPIMDSFIDTVAEGEQTFLDGYWNSGEAEWFKDAVKERGAGALAEAAPELAEFMAQTLAKRLEQAGIDAQRAEDQRYADMHDVHIQVDDLGDDEKLKNALRRHTPNYWRRKGESLEGRGMQAHMLLAVWTVAAKHAVNALLQVEPSLAKDEALKFATGWYFGKGSREWSSSKGDYVTMRTSAQHQKKDGVHLLLLNPVFADGSAAYDLTKDRRTRRYDDAGKEEVMGLQDIEADAIHEACHIMTSRHDQEYANLQTAVTAMFDRAAARREMREAVDAVRAMYGRGKSRIQAMDAEEHGAVLEAEDDKATKAAKGGKGKAAKPAKEPRPAERLLAHAAPVTTMVVGLAAAPENQDFPADTLKDAFAGAVTPVAEGVVEVDCDAVQDLEAGIVAAAQNDWEVPIDLDMVASGATAALEADLAALAIAPDLPVAPSPAAEARGTSWEGPVDATDMAAVEALNAPDLSELAGFSDVLSSLATDTAPPAPEAAPAAAPAPVPAAEPMPDLSVLAAHRDVFAELAGEQAPAVPAPAPAEPKAPARVDRWSQPIDLTADFPPVVEEDGLSLVGDEFGLDDFEAEPAPAPGMRR